MTYTPEQLQAAIDKARVPVPDAPLMWSQADWNRNAHLDTLQAILNRHGGRYITRYPNTYQCGCGGTWPCPDVETVTEALTRMGALEAVESGG